MKFAFSYGLAILGYITQVPFVSFIYSLDHNLCDLFNLSSLKADIIDRKVVQFVNVSVNVLSQEKTLVDINYVRKRGKRWISCE